MADTTSVAVAYDSGRKAVSELVTFSDSANHNMTIVGIPGAVYNLTNLPGAGSIASVTATPGTSPGNTTGIATGVQVPNPIETITFTDNNGNTVTLLGAPNTVYDLTLLPYLLALSTTFDMFMTMQFGDDYNRIKNMNLQSVGLV